MKKVSSLIKKSYRTIKNKTLRMNQQAKKSMIEFIDAILTFDGWHNIGSVLLFPKGTENKGKELRDYFDDINVLWNMDKDNNLELLVDAIQSYDNALEDDWLPDYIIGLPTPKAYLFLKDIKEIILTVEDKDIEDALIDARNKLLDS